jgi:hypothetical protein
LVFACVVEAPYLDKIRKDWAAATTSFMSIEEKAIPIPVSPLRQ